MARLAPRLALAAALLLAPVACGDDGAGGDVIYVPEEPEDDKPSDELYRLLLDALAQGAAVTDDARATVLTAPIEGQVVPREAPFTFTFGTVLRHGCVNGTFVLLQFTGLERPLDVIGGCENTGVPPFVSFTPEPSVWARFTAAPGPISLTLTNAVFSRGDLQEGPFRASDPTVVFTVGP